MGGIGGRVAAGAVAGAKALGAAGAAPGIRAGAIAPSDDGAPEAPVGLPGMPGAWAGRGMPAGAIDGIPGAADGALRGAAAAPAAPAGTAGRLGEGAKLGAKPGANAGRGAPGAPAGGAPAGGMRTDEPGVGLRAGGAIGALPIPIPCDAIEPTPRGGVTAGRAALAMLCAAGAPGAAAAGRRPGVAGEDTRCGAAGGANGLPARLGIAPGETEEPDFRSGAVAVAVAVAEPEPNPPCAAAACAAAWAPAAWAAPACADEPLALSIAIRITPPQTEQRARTPPGGMRAGSTRKTDRHSPQAMFTGPPRSLRRRRG